MSDTKTTESPSYELTDDQIKQFKEQGFLGPFDLYDRKAVKALWSTVQRKVMDRENCIYAEGDGLSGATNIVDYDRHFDIPELSKHICHPGIVERVRSLLGNDVFAWRSEFFAKHKGDEGTDWHQASNFAHASGKKQLIWPEDIDHLGGTITVWTAFTNSTKKNGCLQLMPGTHKQMYYDESKGMEYDAEVINKKQKNSVKRGFFGYDYRQLQIDPDWRPDESKAFPVEMKAGQFIIFWSTLMHASYPHRSSQNDPRLGYVCRYVPTSVQVYPDTDVLSEYGATVPLEKYGAVLVSGEDKFKHNRVATCNVHGTPFDYIESR